MKRNKKIFFIVLAFIVMLGPAAVPTPVWAAPSVTADSTKNYIGLSSASGVDLSSTPVIVGTGITVTITATGDRQAEAAVTNGDERYIPVSWESNELVGGTTVGGIFTSTGSIYTDDYTTSTAAAAGYYTVTATFRLERWNAGTSAWVDVSTPDTKTATLYVSDPTLASAAGNSVSVSPAAVTAGSAATITAEGDRQNRGGEVIGDERYVPTVWVSTETGKSGSFALSGYQYASNYTPSAAGSYTVTATFQLQRYDGNHHWIDAAGSTDTKTTAALTVNSAPGGGGGGSGHGGGSSPKTVLTATVESTEFSKKVPVTVNEASDSAKASVDKAVLEEGFDKNETDSSGINKVTVLMPEVKNAQSYGVELPADILSSEKSERAIEINTGIATVTVPENMLTAGAGIEKVLLTIASGDISKLDESIRAQIGERPVVELNLKADGKQTDWSNEKASVTVTIPYKPTAAELNDPENILVWYIDGKGKAVCVPNGHYDAGAGTVTFTTSHFSCYAAGYNQVAFKDVQAGSWYYKAVGFIAARGITTGMENGNFDPGTKLTRGEFIVMLMRSCGIAHDENPSDNFSDAGNTYYTGYLAAAKRLGITAGLGDNLYAPDKQICRQEMFTLLYNSLKLRGSLPQDSSGQTLSAFSDADRIAGWAKEAMEQMAENGIAGGSGGKLFPTAAATRAEMAQIFYNLLSK